MNLSQEKIKEIIIEEYPDADNKILSSKLGIKEQTLRSRASKLGVKKSKSFMENYYKKLHKNKRLRYEENYKDYKMNNIQKNIIIGSLLGDGTLSKYGRSLNALYRENTGPKQISYREWKADQLSNLDFKVNSKGAIYSPSHPIYTELYEMFYPNGIKIIPNKGLEMLNHPIGLACLFMDDGSLVINNYKKFNSITLFPQIILYSQSFTKEENITLLNHIKNIFNIEFKLSKRSDGSNYILKINKQNEVYKFIKIVKPYIIDIPNMKYKVDVENKLKETKRRFKNKYPDKNIKISHKITTNNSYSKEDEEEIIHMINMGFTYKEISNSLGRSYYGLYDKVRRMGV